MIWTKSGSQAQMEVDDVYCTLYGERWLVHAFDWPWPWSLPLRCVNANGQARRYGWDGHCKDVRDRLVCVADDYPEYIRRLKPLGESRQIIL